MALGKRKRKQDELFIPVAKLATGARHLFYAKLIEVQVGARVKRTRSTTVAKTKFNAAKRLGIGRQTLYNKIRDYGIPE